MCGYLSLVLLTAFVLFGQELEDQKRGTVPSPDTDCDSLIPMSLKVKELLTGGAVQYIHEEEEKSKAIKAAVGSLFLSSSVDLVAAQAIELILFFFFLNNLPVSFLRLSPFLSPLP